VARAAVAQFAGLEPSQIVISAPGLLHLPPEQSVPALNTSANPLVAEQDAAVAQSKAQLAALERAYFPRFYAQGAAYARGTGAELDGAIRGGLNGLGPNIQDYALGFTVQFPVLDRFAIQAREAAQSAVVRANSARSQQIAAEVRARWNMAVATLQGARRIVENTPVQVSAARAAVQQASARYQSGLGNIDDVAEAQRLLTQAEIDDALARLGVWRGLLEIAIGAGDIRPFAEEVDR
jgi:outer membrane protein TolC